MHDLINALEINKFGTDRFGNRFEVLGFSVKFEEMPTLLLVNGLRFFFYSNENNEPIHVHVTKGSANGKIWLEPVMQVDFLIGFSNAEEKDILDVVNTNLEQFKKKWNEYFNK